MSSAIAFRNAELCEYLGGQGIKPSRFMSVLAKVLVQQLKTGRGEAGIGVQIVEGYAYPEYERAWLIEPLCKVAEEDVLVELCDDGVPF
jgi:hypothetical protein